jgi:hypothetical protein
MSKILFLTTRDPFSKRFSGDVIRSARIIRLLEQKYKVDVLYLSKENKINNNRISFKSPNLLLKLFYCIRFLLKFEPMQLGFFYSKEIKKYVDLNAKNYDVIFFYHFRSAPYLPKEFRGKKILEMGDLYSENYSQTYKNLSTINPLFYFYFLESFFLKKYEKKIFNTFDKIILYSKTEVKTIKSYFKKKIIYIPEVVNHISEKVKKVKNKFNFSKKNYKIIFIGNLSYLPNKLACYNFAYKVLPKILLLDKRIEFHIIGNLNIIDKFILTRKSNVRAIGQKKKLDKFIKKAICGISNLKIATGVQAKIFTYMTYGIPVVSSPKAAKNFEKNILEYKSNKELIKIIIDLSKSKTLSLNYSKKSLKFIKNFFWTDIVKNYVNILKS